MPCCNLEKECSETTYYYQEYKISCANLDYDSILRFLRSKQYNDRGLFLKDIDITRDYAGSFNREEVIQSMIDNYRFRMQQSDMEGDRTILNNTHKVGENCLTYMETVGGNDYTM